MGRQATSVGSGDGGGRNGQERGLWLRPAWIRRSHCHLSVFRPQVAVAEAWASLSGHLSASPPLNGSGCRSVVEGASPFAFLFVIS